MICIEPLQRTKFDMTILSVTIPVISYPPVELNNAEGLSPAAVVSFKPSNSERSFVNTLVQLIPWLDKIFCRNVVFGLAIVEACSAAAKVETSWAEIVTPCI